MKNILLITLIALLFVFTGKAQSAQINADSLASMKYILLGEKAFNNEQYDIAIFNFDKALEVDSNSGFAACGLVLTYIRTGKYEDVIHYADRGLLIYERTNIPKDNCYNQMVKFKSYSLNLMDRHEEAYTFIVDKYPMRKNDYFFHIVRAMAFHKVGKLQSAFEEMKIAYEIKPEDYETLSLYGTILFDLKNYSDAIQYLEKANAILGEEKLQNYFLLGCSYYALQDYRKAIVNLEYYLKNAQGEEFLGKNKLLTLDFLSKSYYKLEMYELAAHVFKQLFEMKEEDEISKYFYAFSLAKSGSHSLAISVLTECIAKYPNEGLFYLGYGSVELLKKNNAKALEYYNMALDRGTAVLDAFEFYNTVATGFQILDGPAGLLKTWEKAVSVLENDITSRMYLLVLYSSELTRYTKEVKVLAEELIALTENDPKSKAYFLGVKTALFFNSYTSEEAFSWINEAISLVPYPDFYINRAMVALFSTDAAKYRENKDNLQAIIDDLDIALHSGDRLRDVYLLKAIAYKQFGDNLRACETINSVKNIMSINFTKKEVEMFCDFNKKKNSLLDYNYNFNISTYDEFLDAVK